MADPRSPAKDPTIGELHRSTILVDQVKLMNAHQHLVDDLAPGFGLPAGMELCGTREEVLPNLVEGLLLQRADGQRLEVDRLIATKGIE